jgi:antitoxin component YwqK of YwqJK toxin-antitoxin module
MLKKLLYLISFFCFSAVTNAQQRDTIVYYFKYFEGFENERNTRRVSTIDSADFIRMILPADTGDTRLNVHEYYPNGITKLIGKAYSNDEFSLKFDKMSFSDDVIDFYPDGKRKAITQYADGHKNGFEYTYYHNGKLFTRVKHQYEVRSYTAKRFMLDCYDTNGTLICENGKGRWIIYDDEIQRKLLEGAVVNGLPEGIWKGETGTTKEDSVVYTYKYKNGKFIGGEGFDRSGVAYPFERETTMASYKWGLFTFVDMIKRKANGLKNAEGKKISLKDVKVTFIVEKNGDISHPEVLGDLDGTAKKKIEAVLLSLNPAKWLPSRYFGIPVKTKMIVPFSYSNLNNNSKQVSFGEMIVEL